MGVVFVSAWWVFGFHRLGGHTPLAALAPLSLRFAARKGLFFPNDSSALGWTFRPLEQWLSPE